MPGTTPPDTPDAPAPATAPRPAQPATDPTGQQPPGPPAPPFTGPLPTVPAPSGELVQAYPPDYHPTKLRQLIGPYRGPRDMDGMLRTAAELCKARGVPRDYRNRPDMYALLQHALDLDIGISIAWQNLFFNEDGVGGMRARLMHALCIRAGHQLAPVRVSSSEVCMQLKRGDGKPGGRARWTLAEAKLNNLTAESRKNNPWIGYGEDMLWARATSRTIRRYAPEIIAGFYEVSELGDIPLIDTLDSEDSRSAARDTDGNLIVAPDVADLLKELEDCTCLLDVRKLWQKTNESGLLAEYAGESDGVTLTVQEVLFDVGQGFQAREEKQAAEAAEAAAAAKAAAEGKPPPRKKAPRKAAPRKPAVSTVAATAAKKAAAAAPPPADVTPIDLTDVDDGSTEGKVAGTGGQLRCRCDAAVVTSTGQHQEGCIRDRH